MFLLLYVVIICINAIYVAMNTCGWLPFRTLLVLRFRFWISEHELMKHLNHCYFRFIQLSASARGMYMVKSKTSLYKTHLESLVLF